MYKIIIYVLYTFSYYYNILICNMYQCNKFQHVISTFYLMHSFSFQSRSLSKNDYICWKQHNKIKNNLKMINITSNPDNIRRIQFIIAYTKFLYLIKTFYYNFKVIFILVFQHIKRNIFIFSATIIIKYWWE